MRAIEEETFHHDTQHQFGRIASVQPHNNSARELNSRDLSEQNSEMLNKAQKLLLGIVLLVLVDIIWVSSSELTKVGSDAWCND